MLADYISLSKDVKAIVLRRNDGNARINNKEPSHYLLVVGCFRDRRRVCGPSKSAARRVIRSGDDQLFSQKVIENKIFHSYRLANSRNQPPFFVAGDFE
jgi:hypothetical protein